MNLLGKISVKNVCGKITVKKDDEERPLMQVMGIVTGSMIKSSQYGDSIGFKGQFKATNVETGEVYRSGVCYLPGVASDLVAGGMGEGVNSLEFAFGISVKPADNPIGYEYIVASLLDVSESDPLEALEGKLNAPALPAPKKGKK